MVLYFMCSSESYSFLPKSTLCLRGSSMLRTLALVYCYHSCVVFCCIKYKFIRFPVDGHLACIRFSAIINTSADILAHF